MPGVFIRREEEKRQLYRQKMGRPMGRTPCEDGWYR
jgi:hypothetical protein